MLANANLVRGTRKADNDVVSQMSAGRSTRSRFGSERGSAVLEVGLMLPWIVFSFLAVLDFGFCAYGLIATENAARVAATWGAANLTNYANINSTNACTYAAAQFNDAPTPVSACGTNLSVTVTEPGAGSLQTVKVAVTYTVNLVAIPGLMPSSLAITKTAEMPVR